MDKLKAIQKRIAEIKSEKDELHPLLHELFSRHPAVTRVEYTHGPNEMGADFVVARTDTFLNREQHVGVVAKVGKVHQDLTAVDRQINECLTIRRHIEGGKKEV